MKLHEQVQLLKKMNARYEEGLQDLRIYLTSSKYTKENNQCNVNDILLRMEELKSDVYALEDYQELSLI